MNQNCELDLRSEGARWTDAMWLMIVRMMEKEEGSERGTREGK